MHACDSLLQACDFVQSLVTSDKLVLKVSRQGKSLKVRSVIEQDIGDGRDVCSNLLVDSIPAHVGCRAFAILGDAAANQRRLTSQKLRIVGSCESQAAA